MKRFFVIFFSMFLISHSFSQTETEEEFVEISNDEDFSDSDSDSDSDFDFDVKKSAFFLTFGPNLMINTDDKTKSAPNPVMYSLGFGYDFRQDKNVFGEIRGSFFTNYYLWDGENAQPAEMENRTATAFSLMIDATAGHIWNKKNVQLALSGGLGILARVGFLSGGIESDDYGGTPTSTAKDDVSSINSWFYSKANFLHPEFCFSVLFQNPSFPKIRFGGEFRTYVSLGSIIDDDFLDGMIFSLSFKLQF